MNDCLTCKWNTILEATVCSQGHSRHYALEKAGRYIENCHAWEEKERCPCYAFLPSSKAMVHYDPVGSGWVDLKFCPKCGRKLYET